MLGEHVKQAGSYVGPDRLRFDFSHYEAVTAEQIQEIEELVNAETLRNERARAFETSKTEAEAMGAIAFFGDKYGDIVRVLEAGPSVELCGGTHVSATGDIGTVKVVSESSIGSNLRRIEAITGAASVELLQRDERLLGQISQLVGTHRRRRGRACSASSTRSRRSRPSSSTLRTQLATGRAAEIAASATDGVVVERIDGVEPGDLRDLAIAVRQQPVSGGWCCSARRRRAASASSPPCSPTKGSRPPISSRPRRAPWVVVAAARATSRPAGGKDPSGLDEAMRIALEAATA